MTDGWFRPGVYLSYNGDSGVEAGFNCLPGNPPRLIQRYFSFVGRKRVDAFLEGNRGGLPPGTARSSRCLSRHTFKQTRVRSEASDRPSSLKSNETEIGKGCLRGVS